MLNTDTHTRADGLRVDLAIDTVQYLARRLLEAPLDRRDDRLGRPWRLRGRLPSRSSPTALEFLRLMHLHGFGVVVVDDAGGVVVTVDPWACRGGGTPELRLDLASRLSEQHAAPLDGAAAEDAASSAYVFALGQTAVYLEYLTREPATPREAADCPIDPTAPPSGGAVGRGAPAVVTADPHPVELDRGAARSSGV